MRLSMKLYTRFLVAGALALALVSTLLWATGTQAQPAGSLPSQPATAGSKIVPQVLADTANGNSTSIVVLLADQANVSAGYSMTDQDARGWYVYNTLVNQAQKTQAGLSAYFKAHGIPYQSYWAANMMVVTADRTLVTNLAARSDVKLIESNAPERWIEDPVIANYQPAPQSSSPDTIEWGVQRVNAPQVWALGYTGQGIVIGNEDTGMQWDHPALKPHYRGWNGTTADHNYNWHDSVHSGGGSCGANSLFPCDDSGHGTHTTGTTSGDDGAGNQIGVAPGAKWIGCRNMNVGVGTPASYTECFQFMMAPTDLNGNNPNPALRAHVINNSWGCPASEGCAAGTLETIVNSVQAAGIFMEASAGNSGSGCSTVSDPPALYSASFSTGAMDINNTLASFSSRGPSTYYTPNLLKPNITAPGVNNRSAYPTNTYASLSGTSMAGPHVVGVVALLWSARPQLSRQITQTKTILQNTANPGVIVSPVQTCGGIPSSTIPNNSFGYGYVDALAAVNSVPLDTPTPTVTGTQPTPTRTVTAAPATNTPTPTQTPCSSSAIVNGGFETGSLTPWTVLGTNPAPVVSNALAHSGTYSALLGTLSGPEPNGDGSMYQTITVPASGGTLSYWWNGQTTDSITFDWQDAYITDTSGTILTTIMHNCQTTSGWVNQTFNMAAYAGQTVRIEFLVHQDGFGDDTSMYVDDVTLLTACATGTPATNTPVSATNTPSSASPTPTCLAGPGGWTAGPDLPTTLVRAVGVYFPADGNFYTVGGRTSDAAGADFQHVLKYSPSSNTWTQMASTLPDNQMNNMACGVLTVAGTPYIYCVGGSAATQTTATARVFQYNPATDTVTTLPAGDNWPGDASGTVLPGGFAVANNKLYILGGFNINVASTNAIYGFDPTAASGSRWATSAATTPSGIMYAPTAYFPGTGLIYVLGASDYQGGTVVDTATSFSFNPATNAIGTIAAIPRATGETRALVLGGQIWVMGGGRVAPNPSTEIDIYSPASNTWSLGSPFTTARRNFATDSDGSRAWLAGGYASDGVTALSSMEIFSPPVVCGTPSETPTLAPDPTPMPPTHTPTTVPASATPIAPTQTPGGPTATTVPSGTPVPPPTITPGGPSPTPCTIHFSDVHPTDYWYVPVEYLYCHSVISGYADGTFRPFADTTRSQMVKIVVLGFQKPIHTPSGGNYTFTDVPPSNPFFAYVETAAALNIISGYNCGGVGEPCDPQNRNYFRPFAPVTRGQLSKIDVVAAGWSLVNPPTGSFEDVAFGSAFYQFVETAYCHNIISGYACGGTGEPCDPGNRPYFRQGTNAVRAQIAKIVYLSITTSSICALPTPTPAP